MEGRNDRHICLKDSELLVASSFASYLYRRTCLTPLLYPLSYHTCLMLHSSHASPAASHNCLMYCISTLASLLMPHPLHHHVTDSQHCFILCLTALTNVLLYNLASCHSSQPCLMPCLMPFLTTLPHALHHLMPCITTPTPTTLPHALPHPLASRLLMHQVPLSILMAASQVCAPRV